MIGMTGFPVFVCLTFLIGMAAFATVGGNEPLLNNQIEKPDQVQSYIYFFQLVPPISS